MRCTNNSIMTKIALDAMKARALAESVGIIPHPPLMFKTSAFSSFLRPAKRLASGTLKNMQTRTMFKPISPSQYSGLFSKSTMYKPPTNVTTLYHGGAEGLDMSKIDPFRIAGRQLKKTSTTPKTYGGFYTSPDPNYARRFGKTYKMDISPDARILYTDKYTTRIPLYQRKELARKYDILAGRDIGAGGAPEYIVLNKRSISNFSPQAVG